MKTTLRRRDFLKLATGAVALPTLVPSSVFGASAPSNRIVMGAIGVGSMGTGDLNGFIGKPEVRMVAVCDVDRNHRENAKQIVDSHYGNSDCASYLDYRELIARGDLDAVQLALPDHWHALPAIAAAQEGLDIHGQKPLARSIREGRAICDAVHRHGVVWQTGSQQRSDSKFRRAAELVRNGRIGKVLKVEVGLPTGGGGGDMTPKPPPEGLDWNWWLGPAPEVPYFGFGPHWNWRWISDYSGGQLTDWSGHHIDIAHWGMGWDKTGPVQIQGSGDYPTEGLYNVATQYRFVCRYANGIEMTVANNEQLTQGAKWYGDRGWIHVNRAGLNASSPELLQEEIGPNENRLYVSRDHKQNFLDCVRSRKETICPAEVGHRSISVGLLGEIAMLTGRRIQWDPDKEEILNDPGASALLGRAYREPWVL